MTQNEIDALKVALEAIAKVLLGQNTRADWLDLAAKLRIVLDKDYPVD